MSRALRTGLQLVEVTVSPPLEDEASPQAAAALDGVPSETISEQASNPARPSAKLRNNDFWVSGVEGKMPISFSCLRG